MHDKLFDDIALVSRAARFPNLSAAADHIGVSQPQLSRIVSRVEDTTGIVLLDRTSRRHSRWTADALRLVEAFGTLVQGFKSELGQIKQGAVPERVNLGTLERLADTASSLAANVFGEASIPLVSLDVLDLTPLEAAFVARDCDAIVTVRIPDKARDCIVRALGFQAAPIVAKDKRFGVISPFELSTGAFAGPFEHTFVSNSLALRRAWLGRHGGTGRLPEPKVSDRKGPTSNPVYLLYHEHLPGLLKDVLATF